MKIAVYGYGNLGRGVEAAAAAAPDMELVGIFTRRDPAGIRTIFEETKVYAAERVGEFRDQIDVMILCGGSATDLPRLTPALAKDFCVVDSFDTHAAIPEHFQDVDAAARTGEKLSLISAGWDPGLFSLARLYAGAILPQSQSYTFWGRGVSQGHSDAIRRVPGVEDARQYTVPIEEALKAVRRGENPELTPRQKHRRECYVVAREGADREEIRRQIQTMPNYFADYDTTVEFISREELLRSHSGIPHGGSVISTGRTGVEGKTSRQTVEFRLELESNPQFTASVLVACARAVGKMYAQGRRGCVTMLDVAPADLSPLTGEALRRTLL